MQQSNPAIQKSFTIKKAIHHLNAAINDNFFGIKSIIISIVRLKVNAIYAATRTFCTKS